MAVMQPAEAQKLDLDKPVQAYGEYISENIFKPLRMNHSYVSQDKAKAERMAVVLIIKYFNRIFRV